MKIFHTILFTILCLLMLGATAWGQKTLTWQSTSSTAWATAGNWYDEGAGTTSTTAPTNTDVVVINSSRGATAQPSVTTTGQVCKSLTVGSGFILTIASGSVAKLTTGDGLTGNNDITIQNGGEVDNLSTASAAFGLSSTSNDKFRIDAGGKYLHNTSGSFSTPYPNAACDFDPASTVEWGQNAGTIVTSSPRTYGNLILSATSAKTYTNSGTSTMNINGTLTLSSSNVTFTPQFTSGTFNWNNIVIATGATLNLNSGTPAAAVLNISGNISNSGTFTTNATETINFSGTSLITGNTITFNNGFTVNATKTLAIATNGNILAAAKTATINGTFQINQGGWTGANGTFSYGASGTLVFNNTSGNYGPIDNSHLYWPSSNAPVNVTIQGAGGINLSVARTVSGIFQTSAQANGAGNLTLNGTATINAGGYFTGTPTYGGSSILIYNTGGTYGRGVEWSANSGAGTPASVQLSGNTTLNYTNVPTALNDNMTLAGNLTIDSGSALYMDYGSPGWAKSLTVNGNIVVNGNLSLGDGVGGDLNVGGNWTYAPGAFNANSRAVTFNGTGTQTITGATSFAYLTVNKASGTVELANDITMNNALTMTSGVINTGANKVVLASTGSLSEAGNGNIVVGNVEATRTVAGANETFGNIGMELSPNSSPYPGSTTITRVTGTAQTGAGNQSIKRYYDVNAATNTGLDLAMVFHYDDVAGELNGKDETKLNLYRSTNSGSTWNALGYTSRNASSNTVSLNNATDLSRWTVSDSANPLVTASSTSSDVVSAGGESVLVSSLINDVSPLSSVNGVQVWQVTVRDGGASADGDVLPTQITAMTITQGAGNQVTDWSQAILAADLYDDATHIASGTIGVSSISFSGLTGLQADDDAAKTLSLRISLKNPLGTGVTDGQKFVFAVTNANVTPGSGVVSSQFASFTTPSSDDTKNAISVIASKLVFTTQPSATGNNGVALAQQPIVTAQDANGNTDLDYSGTVTMTNSGLFTMSGEAVAASSGVVTYTALAINGTGSVTLSTTNGSGLTDATSNSILLGEAEPTTQATGLTFSSIGTTSAMLTWTKGNGAKRIVIARSGSAVSTAPTDALSYTADAAFGNGTPIGSGFTVYADTGNSFTVTGLTTGTTYYFAVYEFNGSGGIENYNVTSPATGSVTPGFVQSAITGNWSSPSTWVGGVLPTSTDDVIIGANTTVTVDDANAVCKNMTFNSSTTSKISFASSSVLSVYGDFTLKSTTQNAIGTWASGAKLKFTGPAATQKLIGWNTGSTASTSFMEVQVDKSSGILTTDKTNEKINIGTSLEIINGAFVVDVTDDINGRTLDGSASTPTITVQSGGTFSVLAGATQIQSGTTSGTPIGKMTVYGNVDLSTTSSNKINLGGVDIESGGIFTLNLGGSSGYFNPGTITVKTGGVLFNLTTTNIWFAGSTVTLENGGIYKTTTSTTPFPPVFNNNGTVRYQRTASGDQTIADMDYYRLEIAFSGNNKVWTLGAARTITDSLEVNNSANLVLTAATSQTLNLNGTLRLTSGSLDNTSSNVVFALANGLTISRATGTILAAPTFGSTVNLRYTSSTASVTTGPELPVSSSVLNNLTVISPDQVVTLGSNVTVNGALSLSSGLFATGANTVYVSATGSSSRISGWLVGMMKKAISTGAVTSTFEIGDTSTYAPVTVSFNNVTNAGDLTATTTSSKHLNIATSGLNETKSVNRYHSLANTGIVFDTASVTFSFDSLDVDAGANADNFVVRKYNGIAWSPATTGTRTATSTQANGITSFSDFAIGEPTTHTITATASTGGSISPVGSVAVNDQENQGFTISADANYHIDSVLVDGLNQGVITSYTFNNITADHSLNAYFSIDTYTITVTQTDHGVISPGTTAANHGSDVGFSITPDEGYHVDSIMVDGVRVDSMAHYTFTNVTMAHSITASYSINMYALNVNIVGNGTVGKVPDFANYSHGSVVDLTATADTGWFFDGWTGDTVSSLNPISLTMNSVKNVTATFVNTPVYAIEASSGAGGTITPSGTINVQQGQDAGFTFTPDAGYHVKAVTVDAVDVPDSLTHYTFVNVTENHTISVSYELNTYTLTVTQTLNGTITPGTSTVTYGGEKQFIITPATGYHVDSVFVDGVFVQDSTTSYTFTNVQANHTITATYAINTYPITSSSGSNGTISPLGTIPVHYGANQRFTFTPNPGYSVDSVMVDGVRNTDSLAGYTFVNVTTTHTIRVTFKINSFTITVIQGLHGTITPGTTSLNYGDNQQFTFAPDAGYHVDSVFVDGVYVTDSLAGYTFNNITANHTLTAKYKINSYTLTVTQGANGTIAPGTVTVNYGDTVVFTITPETGYHVDTVFVDGAAVGSMTSYTFNHVSATHTLTALFAINTYTLDVAVVGNGTVSKSPDQLTYNYGTNVELTATADWGWKFSSWSGDVAGSTNPVLVTMDANKSATATFTQDSAYLVKYRSFNADSLALSRDLLGKLGKPVPVKANKVQFEFIAVANADSITDFHVEFGTAIDTTWTFTTDPPSTAVMVAKSGLKKWDFTFTELVMIGDTVTVTGYGNKGMKQKVSSYWWTKNNVIAGSKLKNPIFTQNVLRSPMPNRINVAQETFVQGGFTATGGMIVGIPQVHKDSIKKYGWVLLKKYTDVMSSLFKVTKSVINLHDQTPRGLDTLLNKKLLAGKKTSLPPTVQDNKLFANMVALKLSIAASALQKTPLGFGELVFDDTIANDFNGLMVKEIAAKVDSMMTYHTLSLAAFSNASTTIERILNAFEGTMDTVSFAPEALTPKVGNLEVTGTAQLVDVTFLHPNPSAVPSIIVPLAVENIVPEQYELEQNYPNPFNPATTIEFSLPNASTVTLKIYNLLGQEVATILNHQAMDEGSQQIEFNATNFASGVYLYRITAESVSEEGVKSTFTSVKKMVLMK